jgi:hypothetical protein
MSKEPPRASFDMLRMLAPADRNDDNRSVKPNALALDQEVRRRPR